MPEQLQPVRTDDPLAHLRAAVAAHGAVATAAKQAGEEVRAGATAPPADRGAAA